MYFAIICPPFFSRFVSLFLFIMFFSVLFLFRLVFSLVLLFPHVSFPCVFYSVVVFLVGKNRPRALGLFVYLSPVLRASASFLLHAIPTSDQ